METLAYLHLAVANEEPKDNNYTLAAIWKNPKLLTCLDPSQFPTRAAVPLLSLTVALGILGLARQAFALVKPGDRNPEVSALQQRLQRLGYFNGPTTGYYGPLTKQAVLKYQQAKGLTPDGVVGTSTRTSLEGQRKQAVEEPVHPIWKRGDRESKVNEIQKTLANAGYPSSTNGVFDRETEDAVRLFQQAKGLKVDGIVGKETLAALSGKPVSEKLENQFSPDVSKLDESQPDVSKSDTLKPDVSKPDELKAQTKKSIRWESIEDPAAQAEEKATKSAWQIGDRDSKVSEIQKQLATAGFQNEANGVFDIKTQEAVRLFQQAKGLRVDGIVGQETLAALSGNSKTLQKPEPEKTTSWYEDKSAPLDPFTR
ncbi:peptidoglycan-binding protein [Allocoleopsis sp.]|uniref:peptidoglycan-binding domain-containing protein n=1 Tax=Allocoleopsis sp. TaxID=3088169 RepID=UPI002FD20010